MIAVFRLLGAPETPAEAAVAPVGVERGLRVAAAAVGACKPELLWSGTVADVNLDRALLQVQALPRDERPAFVYDDSAPPATRLTRLR